MDITSDWPIEVRVGLAYKTKQKQGKNKKATQALHKDRKTCHGWDIFFW